MKSLLSNQGQSALQAVLQQRPLLAFDFDGTLAPIVAHPGQARIPARTAQSLATLARRWPVAIITGRAVEDVTPRLGFTPRFIVGNHGAQDPDDPCQPVWSAALDGLRGRLATQAAALAAAGVQVEDKRHSMALHYRLAPDVLRARQAIAAALQPPQAGLAVVGGNCVVNVVAADAPDKGDAMLALVRRCDAGAALFIGDDLNDEPVFVKAPAHWVTVRVGRAPTRTAARFYLPSAQQVPRLLETLIGLLGAAP